MSTTAIRLTQIKNVATARLLGRSTTGAGAPEEIQIGTGLTLAGGVLSETGGATHYEPITFADEVLIYNHDVLMMEVAN